MRIETTGCRSGIRCRCGALALAGSASCEKCTARSRWMRRKSHRRHHDA